jgi:uncharacterized membrane protein YkvA (DUF1232 family)
MTDNPRPIRPDDVIPPHGASSIQARQLIKDAALMLPNLIKLVGRLLKDPRVPRRSKVALGMAAAYVVSPIDLVPEFIPVFGWADDVLFILFAIDSLIERSGPEVVAEHWDGPGDLLAMIREVTGVTRNIIPKRLSQALDRISG